MPSILETKNSAERIPGITLEPTVALDKKRGNNARKMKLHKTRE